MYSFVLSVLLMGMVPLAPVAPVDSVAPSDLGISAPLPSGSSASLLSLTRKVTASGMIVLDFQSGQTLYAKEADRRRPMGSLTKLMTALIIAENHDLDEVVTVPKGIAATEGHVVHLPEGNHFTVADLLSALLVSSANDSAYTLAIFHSGSASAFVQEMNARAKTLGLQNTSFANPDGMDDSKQWSSPRDIAWLATFVLRKPDLHGRLSLPETTIRSEEGNAIVLENTHVLLHGDTGVIAGKTGTTGGAGQCLVSLVQEGTHEYLVVLLRSRGRYADMRVVLDALAALFV